jgi:copper(I)-binding protein
VRLPWPAVAGGTLVVALGAAGLVRGAVPQEPASAASSDADPMTVTGVYIRPPVPPTKSAAAYFTVRNNTDADDTLVSVTTGAGAEATLHTVGPDGSMSATATGAVVPAHRSLVLSPGTGHVMLESLFGTLRGGDRVSVALQFRDSGTVDVTAPVIPFGQPAPTSPGAPK